MNLKHVFMRPFPFAGSGMSAILQSGKALAALLISACLAGCIAGPELSMPLTAQQSERLKIMWLHAYPDKKGVLLLGQVQRTALLSGPIWGHLHVVAHHSDGSAPLIADTRWQPLPNRGNRMAPFSIVLRTEHPELINRINVEYRTAPDSAD